MGVVASRLGLFLFLILLMLVLYSQLQRLGILDRMIDSAELVDWISGMGNAGPLMILGLMALAIVINPLPSAPIALASGAAYGHTWGTVYVVLGATVGAAIAFTISRQVGYEILCRLLRREPRLGWFGSQNTLFGLVLLSRLIPFISFDLVSYGAGLTPIGFWRFVLATLIGLVPMSFLLTHFGGELSTTDWNTGALVVLVLGLFVLLPFFFTKTGKKP